MLEGDFSGACAVDRGINYSVMNLEEFVSVPLAQ